MDSIWSDVENARQDISDDPVYVILNLCRVAAFLQSDLVLSKKQGGEWALQNLSATYHPLISDALQSYMFDTEPAFDAMETQKFADDMLRRISGLFRSFQGDSSMQPLHEYLCEQHIPPRKIHCLSGDILCLYVCRLFQH